MQICIKASEYDPAIHQIVGGPYSSLEQCGAYCLLTSTTSTSTTTSTTLTTSTTTTSTSSTTSSTSTTAIPSSCGWNGNGRFDVGSWCSGQEPITVQWMQIGDNMWSYTMPLSCGGNSITMTVSCNPNVILTEFNSLSCASKWSANISSTCGAIYLNSNDGTCSNNDPPFWTMSGSFDGCPTPEECCPTTTTTTTTTTAYPCPLDQGYCIVGVTEDGSPACLSLIHI